MLQRGGEMKNDKESFLLIHKEAIDFLTIFIRAVHKAQEENRRLGLPNIYSNGKTIYYELPNGEIVTKLKKRTQSH